MQPIQAYKSLYVSNSYHMLYKVLLLLRDASCTYLANDLTKIRL